MFQSVAIDKIGMQAKVEAKAGILINRSLTLFALVDFLLFIKQLKLSV